MLFIIHVGINMFPGHEFMLFWFGATQKIHVRGQVVAASAGVWISRICFFGAGCSPGFLLAAILFPYIPLSIYICVCMHLCFCFFPLIPMIFLKLQKNVRDCASNNSPGCFDGWISQTSNVLDIPVSLFVLQSGCCVWMPDAVCWGLTAWMWLL